MDDPQDEAIVPASGRLITIDILRGLAILWVVIYHLWGVSVVGFRLIPAPREYDQAFWDRLSGGELLAASTAFTDLLFRLGNNGVTIFMTLSGISLTISAMRSKKATPLYRTYFSRLRKLLVPYWVAWALFIATIAGVAVYQTYAHDGTFVHNFQYLGTAKQIDIDRARAGLLLIPRGLDAAYLFAPAPTLWFVLLLVQYYLLFPILLPVLRRVGPLAFAVLSLAVSVASSWWLIWAYGSLGARGHWWSVWFPFRFFEFGIGMSIGYAMVVYPGLLRRVFSRAPALALLVVLGIGLHTWGSWFDGRSGYWESFSYQLVTAGFAAVVLALVVARPGRILNSAPSRLIALVGVMSYAVLIVNGSFFFINDYMIVHGNQWSSGWWYFVVILYVPLTIVLAYPLSAMLGLLPKKPATRSSETPLAIVPELQRV